MSTIPKTKAIHYPTRDGRPMGETEVHRDDMYDLIVSLKRHYADDPNVCVSGNLLIFYVEGDKHRHISPDVFVTLGIPRRRRDNYLDLGRRKGTGFRHRTDIQIHQGGGFRQKVRALSATC